MTQKSNRPSGETGAAETAGCVVAPEYTAIELVSQSLIDAAINAFLDWKATAETIADIYRKDPARAMALRLVLRERRLFAREMGKAAFAGRA